ncbi:MAG TPA: hypothetical protein DDW94_10535 [Deltaproteobacteria bacterium]|nr:MAG: hypothetical protein A3I81_06030 [Deltaproteobacteria bacterium RIFCSPLOWO2_02_FULL_55_12]HBG47405.1 hypothetical protein [Deltaproteobacteria bacterium]HCY11421.1 hypothetical protein [Deltaproteobacteria bacterium]
MGVFKKVSYLIPKRKMGWTRGFEPGVTELFRILIAALVFIGPDKLPEIARMLWRTFAELKRITDGIIFLSSA